MIEREIKKKVLTAIKDTPVILINGARQVGKSTLIKSLLENDIKGEYINLDNINTLSAIKEDPISFLRNYSETIVIDEVQRAPEILLSIKELVDENRTPGKFILTGSANTLMFSNISDILAGRIEVIEMHPFAQSELSKTYLFKEIVLKGNLQQKKINVVNNIAERILFGGYPEVIARKDDDRKTAWIKSYIESLIQKDIKELINIDRYLEFPKLLRILAGRTGNLLNYAEVSRDSQIPQTSLKRYFSLLNAVFLTVTLPTYSSNLSSRSIKSPKLYFNDTAIVTYLMGLTADNYMQNNNWGKVVENFVFTEIQKNLSFLFEKYTLFYFRNASQQEVDFIIERPDQKIIGIEVKSSAAISSSDFKSLKYIKELNGDIFLRGYLFYMGDKIIPFGKDFTAIPISILF